MTLFVGTCKKGTDMSRNVDVAEVRHMAKLSRLALTEEEEKLFSQQLARILDHMAILEKVDTSGVEPLYSPVCHEEFKRSDDARNLRDRKEILANAPETDGEFFIVPRIV